MTGFTRFDFSNPIENPSLAEIEKIDRLRQQAIDSLEISQDGQYVKCQKCGLAVRMAPKGLGLVRSNGDRITILEQRINRMQYLHGKNKISDREYNSSIREMNEEKAALLKEEEMRDKLRRIPLYSTRITNHKFFCSTCYDQRYRTRRSARRILRTWNIRRSSS